MKKMKKPKTDWKAKAIEAEARIETLQVELSDSRVTAFVLQQELQEAMNGKLVAKIDAQKAQTEIQSLKSEQG